MGSAAGAIPTATATMAPRPVTLRPLGVGEMLDAGLKLFRARFRDMVVATTVVTFPAIVVQVLVQMSSGSPDALLTTDEATGLETLDGSAVAVYLGGTLVSTMVLLIAANVALAGTMRMSIGVYLGEETTWRDSLRFALRRWGRLTALVALTTVGGLVGLLLCIAPYVWLLGIWAVAVPALLVEEVGPLRALGRSRELVRGRFWPVLGTVLLASLLVSVLQGILVAPVIVLQLMESSFLLTSVLTGIAQLLGSALTLPYTAAVTAVIYFDLRVRKEGYDLELLARRVGVDPPPDAEPPPPTGPVAPTGGWGAPAAPPEGWGAPAAPPGGWGAPAAPPGHGAPGPGPTGG
ncbi:hypothetical protein HC251_07990 [Iamia sp. SCSIO 61187]|uniref:hypothetical protein n=1 Tax=Iamia sp. SCSIO 61187 TaxID=2722752 RepID=UPI001C62D69A|nr:hypothetical protein [Iamia sp. SCSIO 61187]QYG92387.1 hypothetical protein HC251_07990 [Iamia sp. SCSIO 61187]